MAPPTPQERVVQPVAAVLTQIDRGRVHNEASIAFADAFAAVHDRGGKATVLIELTIEPAAKHNLDQPAVSGRVISKIPAEKPKPSIFFFGKDGEPTREDPSVRNQHALQIATPVETKVAGGDA